MKTAKTLRPSEQEQVSETSCSLEYERCDPLICPEHLVQMHNARYDWAKRFIRGKRVLDVACGVGYGSQMISNAGAAFVCGVDNDVNVLNTAQERYSGTKVCFLHENAERLAALSRLELFDVVVSFETIEHLECPEKFLLAVTKYMRPSGSLIISTPCRHLGTLESRPRNPFHKREYALDEFAALLRQYFRKIDWYGQGLSFLERDKGIHSIVWESFLRGLYLLCGRRRVSSDTEVFHIKKFSRLRGKLAVAIAHCSEFYRLPKF